jgi:hypothetical protein
MEFSLGVMCAVLPFFLRLAPSLEHPVRDFHIDLGYRNAISPALLRRPGL